MMNRAALQTNTSMSRADALFVLLGRDFHAFLRRVYAELGEKDFQDGWHLRAIGHVLEEVRHGRVQRQIINIQPRSLKSIIASVAWPAWCLGHDPSLKFMCVSYSQELAALFARQCRQVMESDWYRRLFPDTVLIRTAEHDLRTSAGGGRFSTSIGGTVTGFGADIILIDDPQNAADAHSGAERARVAAFWRNTLSSRLNDKRTGRVVLVAQRLHQDDLTGVLLEEGGFNSLRLPTIADEEQQIAIGRGRVHRRLAGDLLQPHRESEAVVDQQRRTLGSADFAAQYQQTPVPTEGAMIKREWVKRDTVVPVEGRVFMAMDTAGKDGVNNDYSAMVVARVIGRDVHVIDVIHDKLAYPDLKRRTIDLCRQHGVWRLLIEDASSGQSLIQDLTRERPGRVPTPVGRPVTRDKTTRVAAASSFIEEGHLWLPEKAAWLADLESELFGFPNARYDDIVDALVHLLLDVKESSVWVAEPVQLLRPSPFLGHGSSDSYDERGYDVIDCTHETWESQTGRWSGFPHKPQRSGKPAHEDWEYTP